MKLPVIIEGVQALMSPSSRRAWIEIDGSLVVSPKVVVALLAEGVD